MFDFQGSIVEECRARRVLTFERAENYCKTAMAIPVILPRQGQSVETCAIVGWKKRVGDAVKAGEVLCEVETDKASFEIEAPADGTLLAIYHEAGSQVPVLATIAAIGKPGEKVEAPAAASAQPTVAQPVPAAASAQPAASASPAARSPVAQPVPATSTDGRKIAASPRARALAAASAVTLSGIQGTGPGGRIIERDVKLAIAGGQKPAAMPAAAPAAALPSGGVREIKVTGVRKLIVERMLASLATTAQLTLNSSADARALQEFRAKFKESPEGMGLRGVTINDMVLFAVSRALLEHPEMNAHFSGDMIRQFADVHLGLAVDTARGLMVPVIRNAHALGLRAMASEAARLAAACREGRITPGRAGGRHFHRDQPRRAGSGKLYAGPQPAPGRNPRGRLNRAAGSAGRGRKRQLRDADRPFTHDQPPGGGRGARRPLSPDTRAGH